MNPLEQLKSVLCGPDGKCCITGSDEDRAIVDRALEALDVPETNFGNMAQPEHIEVYQYQDRSGIWRYFLDEAHRVSTEADGSWPIRNLYTTPPKRELESTTDMMMALADRLGELPDDVDPRAWEHLLVYAPKREQMTDERIIKVAKATKSAEPGTEGYVLPITFARAILAADALKETT